MSSTAILIILQLLGLGILSVIIVAFLFVVVRVFIAYLGDNTFTFQKSHNSSRDAQRQRYYKTNYLSRIDYIIYGLEFLPSNFRSFIIQRVKRFKYFDPSSNNQSSTSTKKYTKYPITNTSIHDGTISRDKTEGQPKENFTIDSY